MRTGQLKSLLAVLRAAGVSEFSDLKSGVSVKLSASVPVPVAVPRGKKTEPTPLLTREAQLAAELRQSKPAQEALLKLGVDVETAAEVLRDVS